MEDNYKVKIKNRLNSPVIYHVPELGGLRREFSGREEKIVTFEELRMLSYTAGGRIILQDYLIIKDPDVIEELGLHVEPEYYYEKEQVIDLLKNGSMDEFLDCLDFAPDGVIDLIKECSISLPLNDVAKREVLKEKFGYDVDKIIEVSKATQEGNEQEAKPSTGRRVAAARSTEDSSQNKVRRTGARDKD